MITSKNFLSFTLTFSWISSVHFFFSLLLFLRLDCSPSTKATEKLKHPRTESAQRIKQRKKDDSPIP